MSRPAEQPSTGVDDTSERPPLPSPALPTRNRRPSRCYNVAMIVAYFVVLIISVVALGSFGKKQADINQLAHKLAGDRIVTDTCILFVRLHEEGPSSNGLCGYVLWGLVSVSIVTFVWLVYSIVLAAIGPKIISLLRVVDLVVIVLACLLSLSLSVIIHTGLDATCKEAGYTGNRCNPFVVRTTNEKLEFFDEINAAKVSSWITTILLLALSAWYAILMMIYCYVGSQRRKQAQQYAHLERQDKELPAHV